MGPALDIIVVVVILGGLAAWLGWGYMSWIRNRPQLSAATACSLAGFTLASVSALLEIGSGVYAQFHKFAFHDPVLMTIYRLGFFAAAFGLASSLVGTASKSPLRWKAPALSTVMLLLWFWAAISE